MELFDTDAFNRTLFFPRADTSLPPAGAVDLAVLVGSDDEEATLHVRVHPASASAGACVLLFHGNGEIVADYDEAAAAFAGAGARLAVVDYRGYGRSTGTPSLRNTIADAHDVLDAVAAHVGGDLVVMGRSLGSACAIELYGARPAARGGAAARVRGVVIESGFTSLARLAQRRGLAFPVAARAVNVFDPIAKLARGTAPLLVMHGARDTLILPDEADVAIAAAGSLHKELVVIEGRGHNDISASPAYWQALARFLRAIAPG